MTSRTAARRYAKALFDVALTEKTDLVSVEQQLVAFVELQTTHELLGKLLLNPAVPAPRKRAAMVALVKSAGSLPVVGKLLVLLAERDRLVILPDLLAAYRDRLMDYQEIVRADVTTATALSPERSAAIEKTLTKATGKTVRLSARVDASIIGGLVARLGGTVYDASVVRQLQRIKQRLEERQ
jgi:F-type H+-transporting ATPase subunit delta